MAEAYIFDAVRTPRGRGRANGSLHTITPIELAKTVLVALKQRNQLDTSQVDDVVFGCVEPFGEQGANITRVAVLYAGWDVGVPGYQINRYCASGLEAVNTAAAKVMGGMAQLAVGGGVESMSRVPMGAGGGAWPSDPQVAASTLFIPQGISADLISTMYGYSRAQVDEVAITSQQRAGVAWAEGRFAKSIVPVVDVNGVVALARDEYLRPETTMADLAKLQPAFQMMGENFGFDAVAQQRYPGIEAIEHIHTAGNSSGIVDGASAVLVGTLEAGKRLGLTPRARIRSFASIGSEPTIMLTGPADSARKALRLAGMGVGDIDLFEINEAFASVVLRFEQDLGVDHDRVNVNGGAIALGHPLGATGAMILGTVLDELERRDLSTGLATLCVGAGMGTATIIERV